MVDWFLHPGGVQGTIRKRRKIVAYDLGENDSLGNREAQKDIQSLRRRKRKVTKRNSGGFASGIKEVKIKAGGRGKGLGYVPKSKGGHKLPSTGFAGMLGVKQTTWKAHSLI